MHWIAPSERDAANSTPENRLKDDFDHQAAELDRAITWLSMFEARKIYLDFQTEPTSKSRRTLPRNL